MRALMNRSYLTVCLIGLVSTTTSLAQVNTDIDATQSQENQKASAEFYRGYYLQNQQNDPGAALQAYKQSLSWGANNQLRQKIDSQIESLQEDLAVSDFAQLMPKDAIAFLELNNVGKHFEKLAQTIGIVGQPVEVSDRVILRVDNEIQIPSDFKISPALLREFKKMRGAAVAITGVQERGPTAVAIIHPGDSDLITGLIETGVQLIPTEEMIGGFPTYRVEKDAWFVKTKRLVIAATQRELIEGCIEKIKNSDLESMADDSNFQAARNDHSDYAIFAYVNPNEALRKLGKMRSRELAMCRMLLDMDHMQHLAASLKTSDRGLHFKANLALDEEHNSLAYGMLRTVPLSQKAFGSVPSGAAAVVGMGLNPKMVLAAEAASKQRITGLDLGRELFANIEELALFVLPSISSQSANVPDFGLVIASNDADKSETLWNQLLEIPAMIEMDSGSVAEVQVAGVTANAYRLPEKNAPEILICRLNQDSMVAGTKSAVEAAIEAAQSGENLANDPKARALNQSVTTETAKAIYAHVGRCLELVSHIERGKDAQKLRMIGKVVENLNLTVLCDEGESHLQIRTDLTGLPKFESIIKSLVKMQPNQERVASSYRRSNSDRESKTTVGIQHQKESTQSSVSDSRTDE